MTSADDESETELGANVPEPQGHVFGVPYDWRKPTAARVKSRLWNADDHRLMTPKSFGAGWDINFYWVAHPLDYVKQRAPKTS